MFWLETPSWLFLAIPGHSWLFLATLGHSWPLLAIPGHALPGYLTRLIDNERGDCRFSLIIGQQIVQTVCLDKGMISVSQNGIFTARLAVRS